MDILELYMLYNCMPIFSVETSTHVARYLQCPYLPLNRAQTLIAPLADASCHLPSLYLHVRAAMNDSTTAGITTTTSTSISHYSTYAHKRPSITLLMLFCLLEIDTPRLGIHPYQHIKSFRQQPDAASSSVLRVSPTTPRDKSLTANLPLLPRSGKDCRFTRPHLAVVIRMRRSRLLPIAVPLPQI